MFPFVLSASAALSMSMLLAATNAQFPVPRAQPEFARLGPHVGGYCRAREGDEELFRRAVLPFGPMDLTISKGTWVESDTLRNLYLGFVAVACKVDAAALVQKFHCGKACTVDRRNRLVGNLDQIRKVAKDFAKLSGVDLVSQWGIVGEFRVNNAYTMMG